MKLHADKSEFRAATLAAAKYFSLPEHVIEKDYWVTKLLYNLCHYEHKQYVIFKGGTSLSKGHKLINRFSEDIDLALHPDGIGEGKIHKREGDALHRVVSKIKDSSFTDEKEGKESEGKRYKRVYTFPQNFKYPEDSPIHGKIVLEVNSFSVPTPTESVEIKSLITEYLETTSEKKIISELDLNPFSIEALKPERAFCEKLLALRRASYRGGDFFKERIRHVYDIHQLFCSARIQNWLKNKNDFCEMLNKCHLDDDLNQKISETVARDFKSYVIFSNPLETITLFKTAYEGLRGITFDRTVPDLKDVAHSLKGINDLLNDFEFEK